MEVLIFCDRQRNKHLTIIYGSEDFCYPQEFPKYSGPKCDMTHRGAPIYLLWSKRCDVSHGGLQLTI